MENTNNKLMLKLLIDKKSDKVLFGEANKDVVDFIFSFLALPLGAVIKLLKKDGMVGSIGEVYDSLSKLNEVYILSKEKVSPLLDPPLESTAEVFYNFKSRESPATWVWPRLSEVKTNVLLPPTTHPDTKDRRLYRCFNTNTNFNSKGCRAYVSEVKGTSCPCCGIRLNTEVEFVGSKSDTSTAVEVGSDEKGYVMGVVTYTVMDDLTVTPMSSVSNIALLNKLQIKDLGSLEEITVIIGFEEGLKLLKASLETKTILTDVFLKGNRAAHSHGSSSFRSF